MTKQETQLRSLIRKELKLQMKNSKRKPLVESKTNLVESKLRKVVRKQLLKEFAVAGGMVSMGAINRPNSFYKDLEKLETKTVRKSKKSLNENYYEKELNKLDTKDEYFIKINMSDSNNKTKTLDLNDEFAKFLCNWLKKNYNV